MLKSRIRVSHPKLSKARTIASGLRYSPLSCYLLDIDKIFYYRLEFRLSPLVLLPRQIRERKENLSMYRGQTVFSQLMDFLPRHTFCTCVNRYQGNYRMRSFSCYDQFLCMSHPRSDHRTITRLPAVYKIFSSDDPTRHRLSTVFYKNTNVFNLLFLEFLGMIGSKEGYHAKKESIYNRAVCR
jgi:hypothetical protein